MSYKAVPVVFYKSLSILLLTLLSILISFPSLLLANDVYEGEYVIFESSLIANSQGRRSNSKPKLVKLGTALRSNSSSSRLVSLNPAQVAVDCAPYLAAGYICEPNYHVTVSAVPNDVGYTQLYGMGLIDAPSAWDTNTGSKSVIVAVVDTGVEYNHADLKANMWVNTDEIPNNGIDDDGNGVIDDIHGANYFHGGTGNPMDDHGHGTHCAGTIGGVGNNNIGVAGVNWNVSIMAIKFLGASGGGSTFNAALAIDYAVENGAKVINGSFGGRYPSEALRQALVRAGEAGVLFVAAAGNNGTSNDQLAHYPSNYGAEGLENVISVAATDQNDASAFFSNYGTETVHVAAPGYQILSTWIGGAYRSISGTSMAAPHVAGLASLILAEHPNFNAIQLKNLLINTSDVKSQLIQVSASGGRINAYRALTGQPGSGGGSNGGGSGSGGGGNEEVSITNFIGRLTKLGLGTWSAKIKSPKHQTLSISMKLRSRNDEVSCNLGAITTNSEDLALHGYLPIRKIKYAELIVLGEKKRIKFTAKAREVRRSRASKRRISNLGSLCDKITIKQKE